MQKPSRSCSDSWRPTAISDPALRIVDGNDGHRRISHDWPTDYASARAIQNALRAHIRIQDDLPPVHHIGGVDIGFEDAGATTRAAAVVIEVASGQMVDSALVRQPTRMPYIPGLLSFREVPAGLAALEALEQTPDLIMVDGHGIAHPRRLGVATHLGLVSGFPTIGVAKKRLTGRHDEVGEIKGARTPLIDGQEIIGTVLRSRSSVKPIFISPGHRVGHESAVAWAVRMLTRYKLPEPTRQADRLASNR